MNVLHMKEHNLILKVFYMPVWRCTFSRTKTFLDEFKLLCVWTVLVYYRNIEISKYHIPFSKCENYYSDCASEMMILIQLSYYLLKMGKLKRKRGTFSDLTETSDNNEGYEVNDEVYEPNLDTLANKWFPVLKFPILLNLVPNNPGIMLLDYLKSSSRNKIKVNLREAMVKICMLLSYFVAHLLFFQLLYVDKRSVYLSTLEINKDHEDIYNEGIQGRLHIKKRPEIINGHVVQFRFMSDEDIAIIRDSVAKQMHICASFAIHEVLEKYLIIYLAKVHKLWPKKMNKKERIRKLKEVELIEVQKFILNNSLVSEGIYELAFALINNDYDVFTNETSSVDIEKSKEAFDVLLKRSIKKYISKLSRKRIEQLKQKTVSTQSATTCEPYSSSPQSEVVTTSLTCEPYSSSPQSEVVTTSTTCEPYSSLSNEEIDDDDCCSYYFIDSDNDYDKKLQPHPTSTQSEVEEINDDECCSYYFDSDDDDVFFDEYFDSLDGK